MIDQIPFNLFKTTQDLVDAISIPDTSTILQTMKAIDTGALGIAVIYEGPAKKFVGLVTDGDIRRGLLGGAGLETPVISIPRPRPTVAHASMSIDKISNMFTDRIKIIPILDETGKVVDLAVMDKRLHLPVAEPILREKELQNVMECVLTGWVSSAGKFITQFEAEFARFCQVEYAVASSNGTTALHLALLALGVTPGDEVIVPTLTFIATANAVRYCGATPVFVDSTLEDWTIDPGAIEQAITPRTKGIIPVHLYGHPADMDPINAIARKHGLFVLEDAAEAHGALYRGDPVGGLSDIGIFSFYGNKIITTGEGGMVVTNNPEYAEKARIFRDHGMKPDRKYWHPYLGYNYRMTNLQGALGVAQLERIDSIIEKKREIAQLYSHYMSDIPGVTLPPEAEWAKNVYWLYTIMVTSPDERFTRDDLIHHLQGQNIDSRPVFYPVHQQPIYNTGQNLPNAQFLSEHGVSLPSSVNLHQEQIVQVANAIREFIARP